jgi:hypothetical protein
MRSHCGGMPQRLAGAVLVGALLAGLVLLVTEPVRAYTLEGPRWSGQPSAGCCATLYTQYSVSMYAGDPAIWDNGRFAWNQTPSANIFFNTTSSSVIYLMDVNDTLVNWDGMTTLHSNNGFFTSSSSALNHYWIGGHTGSPAYSAAKAQSVAAHELGHVGGLGEMTTGCELMRIDTATRYDACKDNVPVQDDINGINSLY